MADRLTAALEGYLAHLAVERGLAAHTLSAYRRDLERYVAHLRSVGRSDPAEVTERDVEAMAEAGLAGLEVDHRDHTAEQRERLLARLDDPTKRWKFDPSDVDERARWADYQAAYSDALARCSTPAAPWYVVPADRKWYRNWAVATLAREALDDLALAYPSVSFDVPEQRRRLLDAHETDIVAG